MVLWQGLCQTSLTTDDDHSPTVWSRDIDNVLSTGRIQSLTLFKLFIILVNELKTRVTLLRTVVKNVFIKFNEDYQSPLKVIQIITISVSS